MFFPNKKPQIIKMINPSILDMNANEETNRLKKYKMDKMKDTNTVKINRHSAVYSSDLIFFIG